MTKFKNAINAAENSKINKITSGRKTYISAILFLLVKLFGDKFPFIVENQVVIDQVIEWAIATGVFHKLIKWAKKKMPQWYEYIKMKFN